MDYGIRWRKQGSFEVRIENSERDTKKKEQQQKKKAERKDGVKTVS
jgi:hypothetical protein